MTASAFSNTIEQERRRLGKDLLIMGHHYISDQVIRHVDLRGDSLELARKVGESDARYIVFCGVFFMGESAALLARPGQRVFLPEPQAECSMALMADAPALEAVMAGLTRNGRKVVPLAYVNSTLAVKTVVGRYGGSVCTSANARTMLDWAFSQGDAVLFLPDQNLGHNTADQMGLPELERRVISLPDLGKAYDPAGAEKARLLLWPGYCSIHTDFTVSQVRAMRAAHPGVKIAAHPECSPEVIRAVDARGSTSFLIRYAKEAPAGSTLAIATEINLVKRLAREHAGRVTILPLAESACPYMGETTEALLAAALESLRRSEETGEPSPFEVRVDQERMAPARAALERMLAVCA